MLFLVASLAKGNEPFDRLSTDGAPGIALVMYLGRWRATMNAAVLISL